MLRRAPSTLSREFARHGTSPVTYRAVAAHHLRKPRTLAIHSRLRTVVFSPLAQRWPPEQIARGLPQRYPDETMRIWRPVISRLGSRLWNSGIPVTQWDLGYPQKGVSRRCHKIVWESRRCWCPQREYIAVASWNFAGLSVRRERRYPVASVYRFRHSHGGTGCRRGLV